MNEARVKYSIIVPVYNALKYLPTCIETVVCQGAQNYELIISDDNSTDGTSEFLNSLDDPKIRVIRPGNRISMVEHFSWALNHARGEWIMFLGGDDGLQSYFFELAETLTLQADKDKVRCIVSERAYFFWEGCDSLYGKIAVNYRACLGVKTLSWRYQSFLALFGFKTYFELPQMYTTSLFKRSLVLEAQNKMGGNFFVTVPADANLAAVGCSLERKYLKSEIPFSWVGTAPESCVTTMESVSIPKGSSSFKINYTEMAGNFAIRSCSLYYWNALLLTNAYQSGAINSFLRSKLFMTLLFSSVLDEIRSSKKIDAEPRLHFFKQAVKNNGLNYLSISLLQIPFLILRIFYIVYSRSMRIIFQLFTPKFSLNLFWGSNVKIKMLEVSKDINLSIRPIFKSFEALLGK
jgi:glycosyltransferase involved in cell wall biosynthesis